MAGEKADFFVQNSSAKGRSLCHILVYKHHPFQYIRREYATAIYFPYIITLYNQSLLQRLNFFTNACELNFQPKIKITGITTQNAKFNSMVGFIIFTDLVLICAHFYPVLSHNFIKELGRGLQTLKKGNFGAIKFRMLKNVGLNKSLQNVKLF